MQLRALVMLAAVGFTAHGLKAQICDPTVAPSGLTSSYTLGSGALLKWDAIPGSIGVQIKATSTSGSDVTRRIFGFERDQYVVPEALLSLGTYTWRVQAACSITPPYAVTPVSVSNNFTVGGVGSCPATVTDIDGNTYTTVQIGGQCWMAENLQVEHYLNGDIIPAGLSNSAWQSTTGGAAAVYDNVAANKAAYGLLYNWHAVDDARGLCPTGWHEPADGEWTQLTDFLGGTSVAGGAMKTIGTLSAGTGLWLSPNADATNSSGFSGLPGGYRANTGPFGFQGLSGWWWSSSEFSTFVAWSRNLLYSNGNANRNFVTKLYGFSVRCVQD